MTTAPDLQRDDELAEQVLADVSDPGRGVLPAGEVSVETPTGALVQQLLSDRGWRADDPWTPLRRDLTDPVEDQGSGSR